MSRNQSLTRLLTTIVERIDIPPSLYKKAADRHLSLARWLQGKESGLAAYDPDIRPQGSFRYGTVNRPLLEGEEYDLDNVCLLRKLGKNQLSQAQLKELYGIEIKAYAKANSMLVPVEEKNRCWRLRYADEVEFHLDTLPCVPEDDWVIARLIAAGVSHDLASRAVAITDKGHPEYDRIPASWYSSNPRGFAAWFETRAALGLTRELAEARLRAAVEPVPPYSWKTALQRCIQLLKRHRDVRFRDNPDLAPISMILTNLAAHAYAGETDLADAIENIIDKMPNFVNDARPFVPNPADPVEDYADKWSRDPRLAKAFTEWYFAVKGDFARLKTSRADESLRRRIEELFDVELSQAELSLIEGADSPKSPAIAKAAPALYIPSAPKPWGKR